MRTRCDTPVAPDGELTAEFMRQLTDAMIAVGEARIAAVGGDVQLRQGLLSYPRRAT